MSHLASGFVLSFLLLSCATSQRGTAAIPPGSLEGPPKLDARVELSSVEPTDGSIELVDIQIPEGTDPKAGVEGEFEGIRFPFYPAPDHGDRTYEAVLGVPYNHKPGRFDIKIKVGDREQMVPIIIHEGNYGSEELHVDNRRVNPTRKKDLERIKREQKILGEVYNHVTFEKLWQGPFLLPIDSPVTSPYGTKRVFNGKMQTFHSGMDLRAKTGTPIHAPAPGVVVLAKNLFYTGNTVILDHGYGVLTLYAHMSRIKVKKDQKVTAKQLLGLAGMTGRVNGPHLHWMAIIQKQKVNPLQLTQVMR